MSDTISTRRRFFAKAGAAISAPVVLVTAGVRPAAADVLEAKVVELEDEIALRRLRLDTIADLNGGSRDALDALEQGLRQIVADQEADAAASVVFDTDRASACVRVPCAARLEEPIEAPGSALVDMARLQGEGVVTRVEPRVLEITCARTSAGWALSGAQLRPA